MQEAVEKYTDTTMSITQNIHLMYQDTHLKSNSLLVVCEYDKPITIWGVIS